MGEQPAVLLEFAVIGSVPVSSRAPAVGIYPRMALHATLMAALDDILQGVKPRVLATGTRQVTRPGLDARLVHRVTHRTHLKIDRIEAVDLQRVEQAVHLCLLLSCSSTLRGPVQAPHGGNPCRTELTFGLSISPCLGHQASEQQHKSDSREISFHILKICG